jgi:hypothetical protein
VTGSCSPHSQCVLWQKLKLKSSHSNSLLVGDPADLDMEFPSCLEVQAQEGQQEVHNAESFEQDSSPSGLVFSFPEGTVLEGGSTVLWPLWFHASHAGMLSINTVIYYESDGATVGLMYRTVRMTHTIQVRCTHPSLFQDHVLLCMVFICLLYEKESENWHFNQPVSQIRIHSFGCL